MQRNDATGGAKADIMGSTQWVACISLSFSSKLLHSLARGIFASTQQRRGAISCHDPWCHETACMPIIYGHRRRRENMAPWFLGDGDEYFPHLGSSFSSNRCSARLVKGSKWPGKRSPVFRWLPLEPFKWYYIYIMHPAASFLIVILIFREVKRAQL
jgi:hypothetical protein